MRILITLQKRRTHRYLVNLCTKPTISELRDLIGDQQYDKALDLVYKEGSLEREIHDGELPALEADLILSDTCANWDVIK